MEIVKITNFEDAVQYIMNLDKTCYDIQVDREWYTKRYTGNSITYMVKDIDRVIAYVLVAGISAEMFDAVSKGVLDGDLSISVNSFRSIPARFYYLASVAVSPSYRSQGLAKTLSQKVLIDLGNAPVVALVNDRTEHILENSKLKIKDFGGKYKVAVRFGTELGRAQSGDNRDTLWEVCEKAGAALFYRFSDGDHGYCFEDVLHKIKLNPFTPGIEGELTQYSLQERNLMGLWRETCQKQTQGELK